MAGESYRELFTAIATTAGALTGLLFVALSVAPQRRQQVGPRLIEQIRASAALLCFVNALIVSLFALVPTTSVGYPATVLSVIGVLFTAAAVRSVLAGGFPRRTQLGQFGLFAVLLLIFITQLVSGIAVLGNPSRVSEVQLIGYALITSLIVGISRAWELVSERDMGLFASLAVLVRGSSASRRVIADDEDGTAAAGSSAAAAAAGGAEAGAGTGPAGEIPGRSGAGGAADRDS